MERTDNEAAQIARQLLCRRSIPATELLVNDALRKDVTERLKSVGACLMIDVIHNVALAYGDPELEDGEEVDTERVTSSMKIVLVALFAYLRMPYLRQEKFRDTSLPSANGEINIHSDALKQVVSQSLLVEIEQAVEPAGQDKDSLKELADAYKEQMKAAEAQVLNLEAKRQAIDEYETLLQSGEQVKRQYEVAQGQYEQREAEWQEAKERYDALVSATQQSYRLLVDGMETAVNIVRREINRIGKIVHIQFKLTLDMPSPDQLDVFDADRFNPSLDFKLSFDGGPFRGFQHSHTSGGQQEMASACLLGTMLAAAGQVKDSLSDDLAVGKRERSRWHTAPPMFLDEPLKSLDPINRARVLGTLLYLPFQIIVADPDPEIELRNAANLIVRIEKARGERAAQYITVNRGDAAKSRSQIAAEYCGGQLD
jgi:hypothetical protein